MSVMKDTAIREAVIEMTNFLIQRGFEPREAVEFCESFWKKHSNKLERVI